MRTRRAPPRILWLAATSILAAPLLVADEKPEVPRGPLRADPGPVFEEPGEAGWGKGTVMLPTFAHDGVLVGVLCDNGGESACALDAMLTGCIPSKAVDPGPQFWFGGLYGVIHQPPTSSLVYPPQAQELVVEGTWWLMKGNHGRFSAEIRNCNAAGTEYVCGLIEGTFDAVEPDDPQLTLGPTALDPAIAPETKDGILKHSPFRGVITPDCICPVRPFTPAAPGKSAGGAEDPWEAEGGVGKYLFVDSGPMPYPQHPDFVGAVETPEPPQLVWTFALRYVMFE